MPDWLLSLQKFLFTEEGLWAFISILATLLFLLLLTISIRRWQKVPEDSDNFELLEEVFSYPPPPNLPAEVKPLVLYGLPVRLRLMVLGPLGHDAGTITPDEVDAIVERMVPGLAARLRWDMPRVRLWPTQLSHSGFVAAFRRNTPLPDVEVKLRSWVLVMGKVLYEGKPIAVGLAMQSTEPNTFGPIVLQHAHQWMEVLRLGRTL
ncbi:MAG TPA: hypothetical protein PKD72_08035 [Gemmatales bacterium]|nr:hypothetical protein [Gemmatales bacterium]